MVCSPVQRCPCLGIRALAVRYLLILAVLCLPTTGAAAPEEAVDTTTAKTDFERGLQLLERGQVAAALEAFEASHAARPHPVVQCNVGSLQAQLKHYVEAARTLEECLIADSALPDEARQRFADILETVKQHLGTLVVRVQPKTSQVSLDAEPIEVEGPIVVQSGTHLLEATSEGYRSSTVRLNVAPGELATVVVELEPWTGTLMLTCDRPVGAVQIDGKSLGATPIHQRHSVTTGKHEVRFGALSTVNVTVDKGQTQHLSCPPEIVATEPSRHPLGYAALGTGAGLLVAGTAVVLWQQVQVSAMNSRRDELSHLTKKPSLTAQERQRVAAFDKDQEAQRAETDTWRPIGIATLAVGGALSVVGAGVLFGDELGIRWLGSPTDTHGGVVTLAGIW